MIPIELLDRRLMLFDTKETFRIVALDDVRREFIIGKRGQRAQRLPYELILEGVKAGAILDVTDGRGCPECGGHMTRQKDCRVEELRLKLIKGYHVRGKFETRCYVSTVPVWMCDQCDHCEEER